MTNNDVLKNKTVIVTAGERGMGEVVALRYAASGANIAIISNNDITVTTKTNTNAVAEKILAAGGNALTLNGNFLIYTTNFCKGDAPEGYTERSPCY